MSKSCLRSVARVYDPTLECCDGGYLFIHTTIGFKIFISHFNGAEMSLSVGCGFFVGGCCVDAERRRRCVIAVARREKPVEKKANPDTESSLVLSPVLSAPCGDL